MIDGDVRRHRHRVSGGAGAERKIGVVQVEAVEALRVEADRGSHVAARRDHASVEQPDAVDPAAGRAPDQQIDVRSLGRGGDDMAMGVRLAGVAPEAGQRRGRAGDADDVDLFEVRASRSANALEIGNASSCENTMLAPRARAIPRL